MQLTKVLRGCVTAYLVGALAGWLYYLATIAEGSVTSIGGHLTVLGAALWFGLPVGVALSAVVMALWAGCCLAHLRAVWWMAPVVATGLVFALAQLLGENLGQVAPFSLFFGVVSGLAFWVGAFGLHRGEVIEFHHEEEHALA